MSDIFISCAPQDREKAQMLARALEREGWSVSWDARIHHGNSFDDDARRALRTARCVIVCWSKASLRDPFVLAAAYQAMGQGNLLTVLIDKVDLPRRLGREHATSLAGWDGNTTQLSYRKLCESLERVTGLTSRTRKPAEEKLYRFPSTTEWRFRERDQEPLQRFEPLDENTAAVEFTVYHPRQISPDAWSTLLAYVHLPEVRAAIETDSRERLERDDARGQESERALREIARGAEIRIVPELPGCQFNPPYAPVLWLEDWHRADFKVRASPDVPGFALGKAVNGRVAFYVESVLVGEVSIWAYLSEKAVPADGETDRDSASASAYQAIFASYSHQDAEIVEGLEKAYKALGMTFLRDVQSLRSGEDWNEALLGMIEQADIFQLYWSAAAKTSPHVEQEWRHALALAKKSFIRPVYWQQPMPPPPTELSRLHFAVYPLDLSV